VSGALTTIFLRFPHLPFAPPSAIAGFFAGTSSCTTPGSAGAVSPFGSPAIGYAGPPFPLTFPLPFCTSERGVAAASCLGIRGGGCTGLRGASISSILPDDEALQRVIRGPPLPSRSLAPPARLNSLSPAPARSPCACKQQKVGKTKTRKRVFVIQTVTAGDSYRYQVVSPRRLSEDPLFSLSSLFPSLRTVVRERSNSLYHGGARDYAASAKQDSQAAPPSCKEYL
jgi:hypothetical protein